MDKELNDRLVEIEERLKRIEKAIECTCITMDGGPAFHSWFCPKHGQQSAESFAAQRRTTHRL